MTWLIAMILLTSYAHAAPSDPPFLIRELKTEQDARALNESLRSLSDNIRKMKNDISDTDGSVATSINAAVSGTSGKVAKFTSTNVIGDSIITESGGNIGVSSSAPAYLFTVADGTFNVAGSGIITFGKSLHNIQISTDLAGTSFGGTAFGACVGTLTITAVGAPAYLRVSGEGSVNTTGGGGAWGFNILVDGNVLSGYGVGTTGKGIHGGSFDATATDSAAFSKTFQTTAGVHNICLTQRTASAQFVYGGTTSNQSNSSFIWMVESIK